MALQTAVSLAFATIIVSESDYCLAPLIGIGHAGRMHDKLFIVQCLRPVPVVMYS